VRRHLSLLVNVVLSLVALGSLFWSAALVRGTAGLTKTAATSGSVRTVTVSHGTVTATVTADGRLEAATTASAGFGTSGTVTAVYVKPGDKVNKGTVLAKVDPAAAQRALALANANLAAAEDAVTRAEAASNDTASAVNAVAQAEIAVADAKAGVAATSLTAPIAGTVTAVNGTVGSSASGSSRSGAAASGTAASTSGASGGSTGGQSTSTSGGFVELADLSVLQVSADFSEADATKLRTGQAASITWSALTGAAATGRVLSIDPSGTTSSNVVTYGVTTSIGTLPTGAKPGQSVTVKVTTGTAQNATYVNSAAVTLSGSTYSVTVRKSDGTTETRTVKVGLEGDDADQITAGLTAGETVVVPAPTSSSSSSTNRNQGPGQGAFGGNGGPP
jgi:macrolide-specific efflux system membrane fusion protein